MNIPAALSLSTFIYSCNFLFSQTLVLFPTLLGTTFAIRISLAFSSENLSFFLSVLNSWIYYMALISSHFNYECLDSKPNNWNPNSSKKYYWVLLRTILGVKRWWTCLSTHIARYKEPGSKSWSPPSGRKIHKWWSRTAGVCLFPSLFPQ